MKIEKSECTARQFLIGLRKRYFRLRDDERQKVWQVLSALRGPDTADYDLKAACTTVIRRRVFGNALGGYADSTPDSEHKLHYRKSLPDRYSHFVSHARNAFTALNLKWDSVNGSGVLRS